MRITKITKAAVDKLKPGGPHLSDREIRGLSARRLPSGLVTFSFRYRAADGNQRWRALGIYGTEFQNIEAARTEAKRVAGAVKAEVQEINELKACVQQLEEENRSLREAVVDLTKRLARSGEARRLADNRLFARFANGGE